MQNKNNVDYYLAYDSDEEVVQTRDLLTMP
jgi:hypothetical protein